MSQLFVIPVKKWDPTSEKQYAHQRIQITLSGRTYIINLTWNGRAKSWMLDLFDSQGNPLIYNKFLSNESNVLEDGQWDPRLPPGALGLFSTVKGVVPNYNNLGRDVKLYYLEY